MSSNIGKLNNAGFGSLKLDKDKKKPGLSSQATKNLSKSSAATKSSVFQFGQQKRISFTPGQHKTKDMSKYDYSGPRAQLNGRTFTSSRSVDEGFYFGNIGTQTFTVNNSKSYQTGNIAGQILGTTFGVLNQLGVVGGNKSVQSSSLGDKIDNAFSSIGIGGGKDTSTMTGQLSSVSSFGQLNALESSVASKKANINSSYQNLSPQKDIDNILGDETAKKGLALANVNIDTSKIALSSLDSNDLSGSLQTIDNDIAKIGNFKTNDLTNALTEISGKKSQCNSALSSKETELGQLEANNKDGQNDAQIAQVKKEIEELKEQIKQLEAADKSIREAQGECDSTIKKLEDKQAEIKDIKEFEDKVKDKKYDMAKSQDKELGDQLNKLKKLDQEIKKAQTDKNGAEYDKSDDKRDAKIKKLISERSTLSGSMAKLTSSLSAAGVTEFKNSKNQSYTLKNLNEAKGYGTSS